MPLLYRHRRAIHLCGACCRRFTALTRAIAENDIVALRPKRNFDKSSLKLTAPLVPGGKIQSHKGFISHDEIIGKLPRESIYPADANLIVSLFDIHVTPPSLSSENSTPLEILEAGTGHGSLTLHLARAVHAANTACPPLPSLQTKSSDLKKQISPTTEVDLGDAGVPLKEAGVDKSVLEEERRCAFEEWKSTRGAIVHTLDIDPHNSRHAERIVRGFHCGIYAGNVDFHVGDVSSWVTAQLQLRTTTSTNPTTPQPFLSHIFLDIPNVHAHLSKLQDSLHTDGLLIVFTPSITQIAACVQLIKEQKLPFAMDQVVELGLATTGLGSGRQWDVRVAGTAAETQGLTSQSTAHQSASEPQHTPSPPPQPVTATQDPTTLAGECTPPPTPPLKLVCRPKVGEKLARLAGGGFVGVWRRMRDMRRDS
ncbi:hypothetical protein FGG08_004755 [Glutinoglossum americanum]|uniref:tRNA (adenine(58)-N(1))-methyltransferase catalytic subunit TRM61 n=1 Tax=Glutinoglossum americanum TaxID=1670608 RepID=A0A9P8KWR1_9PEZI|nr:hypothetical protein FGG08_004755 [Glutinoglossum americanum]